MTANTKARKPEMSPELKADLAALKKQFPKGRRVQTTRKAYAGQVGTVQGHVVRGIRVLAVVEITTTKTGATRKQPRTRSIGAQFLQPAPRKTASKPAQKAAA